MNRRGRELLFITAISLGLLGALMLFVGAGPGYRRLDWKHWSDLPGSCQSVRTAVLIRDAVPETVRLSTDGCRVEFGEWVDPYTGAKVHNPSQLDVDHVVPLKNAHDSGGASWKPERKREYANDLTHRWHLVATLGSVNREKGAQGPEAWRPANPEILCDYGRGWATVKFLYQLRSTEAERAAVKQMVGTCQKPP